MNVVKVTRGLFAVELSPDLFWARDCPPEGVALEKATMWARYRPACRRKAKCGPKSSVVQVTQTILYEINRADTNEDALKLLVNVLEFLDESMLFDQSKCVLCEQPFRQDNPGRLVPVLNRTIHICSSCQKKPPILNDNDGSATVN